jgi:hypothetical protein
MVGRWYQRCWDQRQAACRVLCWAPYWLLLPTVAYMENWEFAFIHPPRKSDEVWAWLCWHRDDPRIVWC